MAAVLLAELQAHPRTKANHVVQLLATLETAQHEGTQRSIIHGLKLFFVDAGLEGQLLPPPTTQDDTTQDAAAVYRSWLRRQYMRYTSLLLTLVTGSHHSASVQVASTSALMELARAEGGAGSLSGSLCVRVISAICTAPNVQPEVFSLMFSRYMQYADVRYYTLWAVRAMAVAQLPGAKKAVAPTPIVNGAATTAGGDGQKRAAKKAKTAAGAGAAATTAENGAAPHGNGEVRGGPGGAPDGAEEGLEAAVQGGEGTSGSSLALPDLCRNLFDVLSAVPASLAGCGRQGGAAGGEEEDGDAGAGAGAGALKSWCGTAEAGAVAAKTDRNESSKARRKRKAGEGGGKEEVAGAAVAAGQGLKAVWANAKTQKRLYSEAWLSLLSLPIPSELLSKVLLVVHETLIPNMMHPALLADFLTHCLDQGGLTGMLALNGIFQLVTQHGLEYPAFYTRLYGLLTPSAMASRHRAQFFALADAFLSSPLVPAYTVASFAKRLGRLALKASPAGALLAVAFIHNLIRRHPSCMVLLHNPTQPKQTSWDQPEDEEEEEEEAPNLGAAVNNAGKSKANGTHVVANIDTDPYVEGEPEPSKSRAVESSLWELEALRHHYTPHVSTLCSVLDRDLSDKRKTTEVDIGPLLTTSYTSLFNQEVTRRIKQVPIAFYAQPPTTLFGPHCSSSFEGWALPQAEDGQP